MKIQRQPFSHTTPPMCPIPYTSLDQSHHRGQRSHICQNATKRTRQRRRAEEERDPKLPVPPAVPHGKVKHDSREQTTLRHAKEETRCEESLEVVHEAHQRRHDTPCHGQGWQPQAGRGALEDDVAGDLEEDVADKVQCQTGEVLVSGWVVSVRAGEEEAEEAYSCVHLRGDPRFGRFQLVSSVN